MVQRWSENILCRVESIGKGFQQVSGLVSIKFAGPYDCGMETTKINILFYLILGARNSSTYRPDASILQGMLI